jgi:hypothetical protein
MLGKFAGVEVVPIVPMTRRMSAVKSQFRGVTLASFLSMVFQVNLKS